MAFAAATTSMSDDTCGYDESLPNFDKNTLENILFCKASDDDDMRKLDALLKKLISEGSYRIHACKIYLEVEQKLLNDDHHMYPEHFELLPWVLTNLPVTLDSDLVHSDLCKSYSVFYEYLQTLLKYHSDKTCQGNRKQIIRRRTGMKTAQERMQFMLEYEGLRTMREM